MISISKPKKVEQKKRLTYKGESNKEWNDIAKGNRYKPQHQIIRIDCNKIKMNFELISCFRKRIKSHS